MVRLWISPSNYREYKFPTDGMHVLRSPSYFPRVRIRYDSVFFPSGPCGESFLFRASDIGPPLEDPAHIIDCLRSLPRKSSPHTLQIRAFDHLRWFPHSYSSTSRLQLCAPSHLCSAADCFDTIARAADSMAPIFLLSPSSKNNNFLHLDSPLLLSPVSYILWILLFL